MKKLNLILVFIFSVSMVAMTGCGSGSSDQASTDDRIKNFHQELQIVNPEMQSLSGGVSTQSIISIGTIYLESQLSPVTVSGTSLQASDVFMSGYNSYVAYSGFDTNGAVVKKGAVEHVKPYVCDNPLTALHTEYCLSSVGRVDFPQTDIFSSFSDGNNLYAVGSTSDETYAPSFGRLYKVSLNSNKTPVSVTQTATLPSYAGTSVVVGGSKLLATSGTSTDSTKMGGLSVFNIADLSLVASKTLYDARSVAVSASDSSRAFVVRGKIDASNLGAVVEYNTDGSGSAIRTMASGGNAIAESKSSVQVGQSLILVSAGDQGFKVLCKATGAVLLSQPAVTVSGIPAASTVTNSVIAAPGYIFAANGEAGVYVYQFQKTSAFNSSYCQGVKVILAGRLSLGDGSYAATELSANGIYYTEVYNFLNILSGKLVVVASGNRGISLININSLNVSSTDVDDF